MNAQPSSPPQPPLLRVVEGAARFRLLDWRRTLSTSSLPRSCKHVGATLANYFPNAFPSVARLAHESGYCERTVQRALRGLEKEGYVHAVEHVGGGRFPVTYEATLPIGHTPRLDGTRDDAGVTPGATDDVAPGVTPMPPEDESRKGKVEVGGSGPRPLASLAVGPVPSAGEHDEQEEGGDEPLAWDSHETLTDVDDARDLLLAFDRDVAPLVDAETPSNPGFVGVIVNALRRDPRLDYSDHLELLAFIADRPELLDWASEPTPACVWAEGPFEILVERAARGGGLRPGPWVDKTQGRYLSPTEERALAAAGTPVVPWGQWEEGDPDEPF